MRIFLSILVMLTLWVGLAPGAWSQSQDSGLAIIVNKTNPTEEVSSAELRKIFLAERAHWPQGGSISIAMRDAGQEERTVVLQHICQMNESEFNRYFLQATFTGAVQTLPKRFSTATGIREFVATVPGAIGYVRINELNSSVKPLRVNGRLPNDPGYELTVQIP